MVKLKFLFYFISSNFVPNIARGIYNILHQFHLLLPSRDEFLGKWCLLNLSLCANSVGANHTLPFMNQLQRYLTEHEATKTNTVLWGLLIREVSSTISRVPYLNSDILRWIAQNANLLLRITYAFNKTYINWQKG